jgi:hypothetical protein
MMALLCTVQAVGGVVRVINCKDKQFKQGW